MQESFWDFSIRVYAIPGVADACLRMQNHYNLDINLVLLCAWHGCTHGTIAPGTMQELLSFADTWSHNIVKPLRSVRSWMKGRESILADVTSGSDSYETLRNSIKATELQAEKIQQHQLESIIVTANVDHDSTPAEGDSLENFKNYLQLSGAEAGPELLDHFEEILKNL